MSLDGFGGFSSSIGTSDCHDSSYTNRRQSREILRASSIISFAIWLQAAGISIIHDELVSLGRSLGKGSFGEVFLWTDPKGKHHAAKYFDLMNNGVNLQILKREIMAMHQMTMSLDPHALQLHSVYLTHSNKLYIVMEYMEHGSLTDLLKRIPTIPVDVIQYILSIVASGLQKIHEQNIIHRDIKPSNILIGRNPENGELTIKIADFGLCYHISEESETCQGLAGTLSCMSPEATTYWIYYGKPTDIWSLCMLVLKMCGFTLPHELLKSKDEKRKCLQEYTQDQILEFPPSDRMPPDCCDFTKLCLRVDQYERPTIDEIMEHPFVTDVSATAASEFAGLF